jgi:phage gp36-like protein
MPEIFYCELDDVKGTGVTEEKIIKLSQEKGDQSGVLNQENFDSCRESARSLIDSFCTSKYSRKLPFSPAPEVITLIASQLTKFFLYSRQNALTDDIQKIYDNQIKLLEKVSKGTIKLFEDTTGVVSEDSIQFHHSNLLSSSCPFV